MTALPRTRRALAAAAAGVAAVGLLPGAAHAATALPAIGHVWQIQLENESSTSTYGPCTPGSPTAYLDCTLQPQGVYLADYYSTGHVSLDNYLSETAGLPGNLVTDSDCQYYTEYNGSTATDLQSVTPGGGCVYPATVTTFEDQLDARGTTWTGWMQSMGDDPQREATCGVPATAGVPDDPAAVPPARDDTQSAEATDQYAARHNPFAYFHSLIGASPVTVASLAAAPCAAHVRPFSGFTASLASASSTPAFNWITPDLCNDGHDSPCVGTDITGSNAGGLTSAGHFLQTVVPEIMASPAYQADGLIIITTDEASTSDTSSCCGEVPGTTGVQPVGGGGKTGALLLSPLLAPGTSTTPYNHFSLLRSLEDLFGVTSGGADGQGHLGEAATAPAFGPDVWGTGPAAALPEVPRPALLALPAAGAALVAWRRRPTARRRAGARR